MRTKYYIRVLHYQPKARFGLISVLILVLSAAIRSFRSLWIPSLQHTHQAEPDHHTRGVVLCAHNAVTLRLVWTQIHALRHLHGLANESFTVYHADELNYDDHDTQEAVRRLESLPNVSIENLKDWYHASYSSEQDDKGIERFKGFFCKVGALLSAPHDIVAVVDLDVVFMDNPFALIETSVFHHTGSYLFRDRRTLMEGEGALEDYRKRLNELWRFLHPDRPSDVSKELASSPPFIGWSYHCGEGSLVLMNKKRHFESMGSLQRMVDPELFGITTTGIFGDKEAYWQALALTEKEPGMNPFACADVGHMNEHGNVCNYRQAMAQWVATSRGRPKIFYVNGDAVETLVAGDDDTLLRSWISDPLHAFSSRVPSDNAFTGCNRGANPLPPYVIETFHAYRLIYEQYEDRRTLEKGRAIDKTDT